MVALRQTHADSHAEYTGVALGKAEVKSMIQVVIIGTKGVTVGRLSSR